MVPKNAYYCNMSRVTNQEVSSIKVMASHLRVYLWEKWSINWNLLILRLVLACSRYLTFKCGRNERDKCVSSCRTGPYKTAFECKLRCISKNRIRMR